VPDAGTPAKTDCPGIADSPALPSVMFPSEKEIDEKTPPDESLNDAVSILPISHRKVSFSGVLSITVTDADTEHAVRKSVARVFGIILFILLLRFSRERIL
jgi:hypothetical protein